MVEKSTMMLSGVSIFSGVSFRSVYFFENNLKKTLSQISSSDLKVSMELNPSSAALTTSVLF